MCSSCCWGRSTGGRLFAEADRWRRRARTEAALGRRRTKKSTHGVWACVSDECSGSSDGLLQRGRCVCLPACGRACVCCTTVCSRSNNGADETSRSRSTKRRCGGGWGHRAGKARGENGVGGNGAAVDAVAGRVREWGGGSGGGGRGVLRSRGRGGGEITGTGGHGLVSWQTAVQRGRSSLCDGSSSGDQPVSPRTQATDELDLDLESEWKDGASAPVLIFSFSAVFPGNRAVRSLGGRRSLDGGGCRSVVEGGRRVAAHQCWGTGDVGAGFWPGLGRATPVSRVRPARSLQPRRGRLAPQPIRKGKPPDRRDRCARFGRGIIYLCYLSNYYYLAS